MRIINKTINSLVKNWILVAIILLASVLRLWNLNNVPPHLTPDETALGYNAYSILKTGRDEHGKFLPLIFKSFGDYKPGLYIYTAVPFVATLGLNEWSTRMPSSVAGIVTVYFVYLIVKKLFKDNQKLANVAAFVAATNPWLITFSRGAWEVNLSLTLTLLGVYFFIVSLEKPKQLILSALFFGLTLIAYQGAKLSTGIVLFVLLVCYWKEFFRIDRKIILASSVVGLFFVLPILVSMVTGQVGRLEVFSVFSYPRPKEYIQNMLDEGGEKIGDVNYILFHGEGYNFLRGIMGRWFNHFSGRFIFFEGDWPNPRHTSPYQGVMLLSDLIALSVGAFVLFKDKLKKEYVLILLWLALSSLPAVLSRDQVHAVRSLNMAIPLVLVASLGVNYFLENFKKLRLFFIALFVFSLAYYIDSSFVHLPKHDSKLWEYGYKQMVETVTPIQANYKKVLVQQSFAQPYIYFLFYQKYDPSKYQKQNSYIESEYKGDVGYITKLDNIEFGPIDWSVNRGDRGTLFVADTIRIPVVDSSSDKEFRLIREIRYLDNLNTAFRILEVK